ncbi:MAG: hypothetical protein ACREN1_08350 [Candidatus Dormibacteria bacterium]
MAAQFGVESEEDLRVGRLLEAQTGGRPIELAEPSPLDDVELMAGLDREIEDYFTAPDPAPGYLDLAHLPPPTPEADRLLRQLEEMGPSQWRQR